MTVTPPKLGAIYQHYKTKGFYLVIDIAQHTGDEHPDPPPYMMVYYYSFAERRCFTRPVTEFIAWVTPEGAEFSVPRFALIDDIKLTVVPAR